MKKNTRFRIIMLILMINIIMIVLLELGQRIQADADNQGIKLSAWMRPALDSSRPLGAYLTITNYTQESITLTRAQSDSFSKVEIHETYQMQSGGEVSEHSNHSKMMAMREVESIVIDAGEVFAMKPGGFHLMLLQAQDPEKGYQLGDKVGLNLQFTTFKGEVIDVRVEVETRG